MHTIEYNVFSPTEIFSPVIDGIHRYGVEEAAVFRTIEFNVFEGRDITYKALISEKQRIIFLKNVDALIEMYLKMRRMYCDINYLDNKYPGLTHFFNLDDNWEEIICHRIFGSFYCVFYAIELELPIEYSNDNSLRELTILVESYLKYLGKDDDIPAMMQRLKKINAEESFQHEEDILLPTTKIDEDLTFPEEDAVQYEVRQEVDGLFYATVSEKTALRFTKYKKELVELAHDNYFIFRDKCYQFKGLHSIFFPKLQLKINDSYLFSVLQNIINLVVKIINFPLIPEPKILYVTRRHLEEIHIMAQLCLEIGLFHTEVVYSGNEIEDSVQLAKIIDANIKTLVPTGSKTKPAIRELL